MPEGPRGERRPADAIGCAVMVGRIATGEVENVSDCSAPINTKNARSGGLARSRNLTKERRSGIAKKASAVRWS